MLKQLINTPELWWSLITLICALVIIYLTLKQKSKDFTADAYKATLLTLILVMCVTSLLCQSALRDRIPPVYVNLPEEWPIIDTNDTDTLVVSLSPNRDTLYTSFLIKGFTDLEVEQEAEERHNRWLQHKKNQTP